MSSSPNTEPTPDPLVPSAEPSAAAPGLARGRLWIGAAAAGLAAALGSWAIGEGLLAAYHERLHPPLPMFPPPSLTFAIWAAEKEVASLTVASLGAILGLGLGVVGGLARRAVGSAVRGGLVGLLLGSVAGGLAAMAFLSIYYAYYDPRTEALLLSLVTHAGPAAALGAAAGAALGLGLRDRIGSALVGGVAGAAVGALLYEILGALALPFAGTGAPMAAAMGPRLLLPLMVAVPAALGAAWAVQNPPTRRVKTQAQAPPPA